jgi:CubicO group peptidase (beta-lactamase class C family)
VTRGGFSSDRLARLDARMQRFVDDGRFAGVASLIWRRGEVVHEHLCGLQDIENGVPMRRDAIFRIASMTKPVVSAAAMILVEDGVLRLHDPVARWLPEAANLRVLRSPDAELDDTVAARRQPTVFDLLTHTGGFAQYGGEAPIGRAVVERTGRFPAWTCDADGFAKAIGALPLATQPGTCWHYGLSTDLLGIVVARASGMSLGRFLQERILGPLAMADTGFFVAPEKLARLAVGYERDAQGRLVVHDDPASGGWSRPPLFESGGAGLASTLDDYLAFARMLLGQGRLAGRQVLSRHSVAQMTRNHLTPEQIRPLSPAVNYLHERGFGLGLAVAFTADAILGSEGRYGWPGAYSTAWLVDPREDLIALLMTQVFYDADLQIRSTFENMVYAAIE